MNREAVRVVLMKPHWPCICLPLHSPCIGWPGASITRQCSPRAACRAPGPCPARMRSACPPRLSAAGRAALPAAPAARGPPLHQAAVWERATGIKAQRDWAGAVFSLHARCTCTACSCAWPPFAERQEPTMPCAPPVRPCCCSRSAEAYSHWPVGVVTWRGHGSETQG